MEGGGVAGLGFTVVCIFAVLLFFGVMLLPMLLLVYALASSAKQEQPEKSQEDTQVVVQEPSSEKPVDGSKEAAMARLQAKGVNIRSDVVIKL